jgi:prefoldin alpha subunit
MSDTEREIEQGIATLEALKVHIDNLQKQIATLEVSIQEHERAIETMESYKDMEDEEILVPIGAGVFIGARVSEKKALL